MGKEIGEGTKVTLDLKTIGIIGFGLATVIGMWFSLQADIQEAKELPAPEIQRIEFQMKHQWGLLLWALKLVTKFLLMHHTVRVNLKY